jgi:signal transduction histidine kinase
VNYVSVSTVVYSLSASDFLVNYGFEFYPTGYLFTTAYTLIIAIAIIEYRLLDINVLIRKTLVYVSLLLILLIPCYVLVVWGQELLFGKINYLFSSMTLALFIIVAFVFPKFRYKTEEALERVLFKKRYDYRATLYRSSRDMVTVVELDALVNKIISTVSIALGTEKASLFLADESKGTFAIKAGIGLSGDHLSELVRDDPLVQRLRISPEALIREELEMRQIGMKHDGLAERMGEMEAEVSLPLVSKDKLIGILNLGHRNDKVIYADEDLEVLSTLANQTAIAIENAQLYENLKESQSIIHRANRLSSLGMLTAGLAHEIRNPLVAIRTFTQLLPERYKDEEFRDNFRLLALKEVDRICGLVNDLLNFARPSAPKVDREDINEIFKSIARILETEGKERGVTVNLHLATGLPKIFVDKEQIKQVSMNIILNAIQSIKDEGVVDVFSRLFIKDGREHFVQIEVRDTGIGIPERDLENIFNPFFTTKENGSGLGLSISHQIVLEHGGYMAVESKVGEGTTFFINLLASQVNYSGANIRLQDHEKDFGR